MLRYVFLLLTVLVFAQSAPEVEITAEPDHHFTFANDQVRIFNVEVAPHSETLMHWHRHDYVYVTLGAADVVNAVKGKDPITVKLADGETRFTPAAFAHVARNLSDQPFRNVTIELLQDEKLRHLAESHHGHWDPAHPDEDRGLNILHGGTEEILWVHDAVRASLFELQPGGVAPLHYYKGPHLFVAVSDLDIRSDVSGTGPMSRMSGIKLGSTSSHFKSGDAKWLPGGYSASITNTGRSLARWVTLEFP